LVPGSIYKIRPWFFTALEVFAGGFAAVFAGGFAAIGTWACGFTAIRKMTARR